MKWDNCMKWSFKTKVKVELEYEFSVECELDLAYPWDFPMDENRSARLIGTKLEAVRLLPVDPLKLKVLLTDDIEDQAAKIVRENLSHVWEAEAFKTYYLSRSVSELLAESVRARNCMKRLGINTVGELVSRTASELLECKNFGPGTLDLIEEKLAEIGLALKEG